MDITIKKNKFNDFFKVPFDIYDNLYISPAKSDLKRFLNKNNPTFAGKENFCLFTAYRDGKRVGRISSHIHEKYNQHYNSKRGFFGFFDCINDEQVASLLLEHACQWAKERGMDEIAGNFNLTTQQPMGVVVDHFENPPYMEMMYNPSYIPELLKKNGFEGFFPTTTFEIDLTKLDKNNLMTAKSQSFYENSEFEIKKVSRKHFKQQMKECCHLLNVSFANNPLFVPISDEEFWFQAKEMTYILDEDITQFIYHEGNPVGVVVNVPDINPLLKKHKSRLSLGMIFDLLRLKKNKEKALLVFASVDPKFHAKGLGSAIFNICLDMLVKNGYKKLGITWVSDSNQGSLTGLKRVNARPLHRLNLFKKSL